MGGKVRPENMVTSFTIPRSMREWIESEARDQGTPFSTIMRRAIGLYRSMPLSVRLSLPDPVDSGDAAATPGALETARPPPG